MALFKWHKFLVILAIQCLVKTWLNIRKFRNHTALVANERWNDFSEINKITEKK